MSARKACYPGICPFSLEASKNCNAFKAAFRRKNCPFSLEPCMLIEQSGPHADNRGRTPKGGFGRFYSSISGEIVFAGDWPLGTMKASSIP